MNHSVLEIAEVSEADLAGLAFVSIPVWIWDLDRLAMWWGNPAAIAFWGETTLDGLRHHAFDMSESVRTRLADYRRRHELGRAFVDDWTFYPHGRPAHAQCRFMPIRVAGGRRAMLVEVTVRAPDAETAESRRLVEALRHAPTMVSLHTADGALIMCNPAAQRILGERPGLFAHVADSRHRREAHEILVRDGEFSGQLEVDTANGRGWHQVDARAVTDPATGAAAILVIERDIGDLVRVEEALRRSEQRYRHIVEDQTDLIIRCTPDARLTFVNEACCRYTGLSAEQLIGRSFLDFVPERNRDRVRTVFAGLSPASPVQTVKNRVQLPDGRLRWQRWVNRGVFDAEGRLVEVQGVGQDVTDTEQRTRLLAGHNSVLELIARDADLPTILERLVRVVERIADNGLCSILLVSPDGKRLMHGAAPSLPPDFVRATDGIPIGPGAGSCGTAVHRREPVVARDIATDPLWEHGRELALSHGLRACWSLPIVQGDGPVLGTFALYHRKPAEPDSSDWRLLESMSRLARIAIEQHRRAQALADADERLRRIADNLPGVVLQRVVRPDGTVRYTYISDGCKDLYGLSADEIMSDTSRLWSLYAPGVAEAFAKGLVQASRTLSVHDFEGAFVTAAGERKWARAISRPRRLADGSVLWDGIVLDSTRQKQSELALAAARARLQDAIEAIADGFLLCDSDDRLVVVNSRYHEMFPELVELARPGLPFEGLVRAAAERGVYDSEWTDVASRVRERMLQHRNPGSVVERPRPDGRWLLVNERRTSDGGTVIVHTDITELKRREQDLRHQSLLLQSTLENMDQGLSVVDADLRLVAFNQRFLDLLGFPPELGQVGTPFAEFIRYNAQRGEYGPGDVEKQVRERVELARRFEPHCLERVRSDGRILEIRGNPMPGGGFVTTYADVTERKRVEEAYRQARDQAEKAYGDLAESNRQLDIALGNMTQAIAVFDPDQRLVVSNRRYAEIYQLPDELMRPGTSLRQLVEYSIRIGNYRADQGADVIEERLRQGAARGRRSFFQHLADGRIIEVIHQPLPDGGSVATYTDVTERERIQRALQASEESLRERVRELEDSRERLEQQGRELVQLADNLARARDEAEAANRTKSEFLANMSHELRTPLNAIIGFSEVMLGELFGPLGSSRYRDYAKDVYDSGKHLLALINDILDLSKVEANRLELRETAVDIGGVIAACLRLVRERAQNAGLKLAAPDAGVQPRVSADEIKLKQILLNLLSNAIKFTPAGGTVTISAGGDSDGGVHIRVADSGIGMRPEDVPLALQPFRQIDSALSRKHAGTGLGLPLAKALAELHGGRLEIDSRPGKGTAVILRLPPERVLAMSLVR